eukprot:CAMPEP_0206490348 /NCGR_PEP_ID=MMETSP0324_2-20121206/43987_1 /ASSEMBLY_ACC=CAM_ASM_000836 /TAXON_ID=2866 /ORGANISM="Crypthecodinium cohnii, Strain Seligo" /LENGTH=416 /DNA_ID=CAMNT_0053970611 /DNA_START=14 /DNA_END=1264 /DNA_ORIENTATION=+
MEVDDCNDLDPPLPLEIPAAAATATAGAGKAATIGPSQHERMCAEAPSQEAQSFAAAGPEQPQQQQHRNPGDDNNYAHGGGSSGSSCCCFPFQASGDTHDAEHPNPEVLFSAAARGWLQENKRQEDFRYFAQELEVLIQEGMTARLLSDTDDNRSTLLTLTRGEIYHAELRSVYRWRPLAVDELEKEQHEEGLAECADLALRRRAMVQASAEICIFGRFGPSYLGVGGEERLIVEFEGRRSSCGLVDKGMSWIDYEAIKELQTSLLPSLPSPIIFLEFLLALPLGARGKLGPVPFRAIILEDMLTTECWEEGSDEDSDDAAVGKLSALKFGNEARRSKWNDTEEGKGNAKSKGTGKGKARGSKGKRGSGEDNSDGDSSELSQQEVSQPVGTVPSWSASASVETRQGRSKLRAKRRR